MNARTLMSTAVAHVKPTPEPVCKAPVGAPALALKVGGVTPFSATDYPGKLAAVVFVQGCPWRCGYCHNPHLQQRTGSSPLTWSEVLALLRRRIGLIDAVVFSGGEPTIDPALACAMQAVRELGFGVGLHSAGMYPRRLAEVLPLVNWVGLDIKAPWLTYDIITGMPGSARQVRASVQAVLASGVAHEFRTTAHPGLHSESGLLALAHSLRAMGLRHYALQVFRPTGCADDRLNAMSTVSFPSAGLVARMSALFESFSLRPA